MPKTPIYKVLRTFIYLSDTAVVVFIVNVAAKIGGSPLVFIGPNYTPANMVLAAGNLTTAINAHASDPTEATLLAVENMRGIVDGILRDMASYVEGIAKGVKSVVVASGFSATNPSTASVGLPLQAVGAKFFNNGNVEQLGYTNQVVKNAKGNIVLSSIVLDRFAISAVSNEQLKVVHVSGDILYINLFTGHVTTVYAPQTGKLSGKSYSFNASGLSPVSPLSPVTIP